MPHTQQPYCHIESINDALAAAVRALGGPKKVGATLKPEKTIHEAACWVTDCLNPDRAAEFHPSHVQFLLREACKVDFHESMNFMCGDAGYRNPAPIDPEDEKSRLMREFIDATERNERLVEQIKHLNIGGIRAVA
ncbi:MAG: hypothetical protein V4631_21040 [Pseudomonadota bacterium]